MSATYPFTPAASLPGIAWPALPAGDQAAVFALLDQLAQSQWWPPALLRRQQFRQLAALLDHAARTVPFYRERLASAGWRPGTALDDAAWRRVPLLARRDIQDAGAALDSSAVPPEHGKVGTIKTSGSTGMPIAVRRTQMSGMFWEAITLRDHLWHGRDLGARAAVIRLDSEGRAPAPDGLALAGWGSPTDSYYTTGPSALLTVMAPTAVQVEWLLRRRPAYLLTQPTNLAALLRHCRAHAIDLALRGVSTFGEIVDPALRYACRETLGLEIVDMYSAREAGYIALQCPAFPHYHVQAEDVLVEILDDAGNDCGPGQIGRVVVTPLHEYATPLIRYAIGDFAEPGPPCACGRGLPVLRRIHGRARNRVLLPSGRRIYPHLNSAGLAAIAPVIQVQFVQRSLERLDVLLVAHRVLTASEEVALRALVREWTTWDFALAISYCAEIPRGAGGKYEDFRSELVE